jgi:hypothetical protein
MIGQPLTDILHLNEAPYWTLMFGNANCHLSCFWRLIEKSSVAFSVTDEGQLFGLDKPFSIRQYFSDKIMGQKITNISIGTPIADLRIFLSGEFIIEAYIDSGGYEGWSFGTSEISIQSLGGSGTI